jgi:hypothetical protein
MKSNPKPTKTNLTGDPEIAWKEERTMDTGEDAIEHHWKLKNY